MYTKDTGKLNSIKHTQEDMPFTLRRLMLCMFSFSLFNFVFTNPTEHHLGTLLAVLRTFLLFLSDGLHPHGISPPLKEEVEGHDPAVRVDTHVCKACVQFLQGQVVTQSHQQQLKVVLVQAAGRAAVHFVEHLAQFSFLQELDL